MLKSEDRQIYIACEMIAYSIKSDTMFQVCEVYMNLYKVTL